MIEMSVLPLTLLPCFLLAPGFYRAEPQPSSPTETAAERVAYHPLRGAGDSPLLPRCGESARPLRLPPVRSLAATAAGPAAHPSEHRFWDRENRLLFAAVGASRGLDYSSTLNMRRRGRQEVLLSNEIVDNHAAFAAIEAGGVALSIGASYLFHRYHHHRLERWTSVVHAGLSTAGAVRNYCLKTAQTSPVP
jgi:hypothetical protein